MRNQPVYLKPNVVIEPLIDRWYAWSHLVSPATAAMNITGRHLRIMNSYIQSPEIHAAAAKNPKMLGGPFINLEGNHVEEIKQLRDNTLSTHKDLIALSDAIKELDRKLISKAKGYSLEPLYNEVPELLKGYVELTYDLNNNPSFRFFESLLYQSRLYKPQLQSIALWLTDNDERPFVLSTPRIDKPGMVHLDIPFDHPFIDAISSMKRTPKSINALVEMIDLDPKAEPVFESFFTDTPPMPYRKYQGKKIRMRYFGHACILIETEELNILIDPLISYYGYQQEVARYSDVDLPDIIDYVLITHNHQDHILFETLLPLRHKIKNIVVPRTSSGQLQDPNLKLMFDQIGFSNVIEIGEMETITFEDCTITGIPFIGEHGDLSIQTKICHHVVVSKFSMLFMADSCNVESKLYQHVHDIIGDVDVVFLGMECDGAPLTWLYGPLLTEELHRDKDSTRRFAGSNYERGKCLVDIFNPQEVYVYAMGLEPWLKFISSIRYTEESNPIIASNKLIKYCIEKELVAERLYGEKELFYEKYPITFP
ncbi:MBL fold metallo-hydrolase [Fulvivirgaceae bacterium BMA12]|uniref:MBL fold metallo-hydrolase n=1 Tax=Agaribacillus aureus TaxID=3051825 RepID=A0ABT8LIC9_9BACT|nr:MBL fold metallo-hydrolase [Fulvivirgaceae bacterium BMA12]